MMELYRREKMTGGRLGVLWGAEHTEPYNLASFYRDRAFDVAIASDQVNDRTQ
jgi:hypothetical protein